jgi:hypothetical protein
MLDKLISRGRKGHPGPEHYELTYAECADWLLQQMHAAEPPFNRREWHTATVEIPSEELEATFELICWMNSLAMFLRKVVEQHGAIAGRLLARELVDQLLSRLPNSGPSLVMFFNAILDAPALAPDHPVFARDDCALWSKHTDAFGRAKAALDHVAEIDREDALSLLGPCIAYGSACSLERFNAVVPKIQFIGGLP